MSKKKMKGLGRFIVQLQGHGACIAYCNSLNIPLPLVGGGYVLKNVMGQMLKLENQVEWGMMLCYRWKETTQGVQTT